MKIVYKLTIAFFLIAFVSMLIIGMIAYSKGRGSLEEESFNRLRAVREMKASQIENYFQQIKEQLITLSETPNVIRSLKNFKTGFNSIEADLGISDTAMRSIDRNLEAYFREEYLDSLNKNLLIKATLEEESSKDKRCRILQNLFIVSNPHPVGAKLLLDSAGGESIYNDIHKTFHPRMRKYLDRFGFYDIFLVDNVTGNIVYTVCKEVDFGTSLLDGPYKETNLAEAFRAANASTGKDFAKLVDFRTYRPSYNDQASFIATPVFDGGEKIGVLIFQMPIRRINNIMTSNHEWSKVGLGASGETYIVGEDFTLRNQSRFLIEAPEDYFKLIEEIGVSADTISKIKTFNSSIGLQSVKTPGTEDALKGITGEKIFPDYRGVPVLSSYKPLNIHGMHWVIMSEIDEEEAFMPVQVLKNQIIMAFLGLIVLLSIASVFVSRKITHSLNELTYDARELSKGNFNVEIKVKGKDEIGILAISFKKMQVFIRNLVEELKQINHNLENKVIERTHDLNRQKELVEEKNKEITDSINYAKRIQEAMFPSKEIKYRLFPDAFVLFEPRDVVSGDFYWFTEKNGKRIIASVDCTGHGVPGAFMSMIGISFLNEIVNERGITQPGLILGELRNLIIKALKQTGVVGESKDGMDISLLAFDDKKSTVEFAGANNPLLMFRKEGSSYTIEETAPDKRPIGYFRGEGLPFTNHSIKFQKGDTFYLFTDGYADQFGGPKGKKLKHKNFIELLLTLQEESMLDQEKRLLRSFNEWKGDLEQIDDVLVIGVRV